MTAPELAMALGAPVLAVGKRGSPNPPGPEVGSADGAHEYEADTAAAHLRHGPSGSIDVTETSTPAHSVIQRDWSPFDYLSDNIVGAVAGAIPELAATGAPSLEGTSEAARR